MGRYDLVIAQRRLRASDLPINAASFSINATTSSTSAAEPSLPIPSEINFGVRRFRRLGASAGLASEPRKRFLPDFLVCTLRVMAIGRALAILGITKTSICPLAAADENRASM